MNLDIKQIENNEDVSVLTTKTLPVTFPLTPEIQNFVTALKAKVLELNAAGLAATQVGSNLSIIAYHVHEDALKYRSDIEYLVPLSVLINPSYEIMDANDRTLDWEGCFSVRSQYGKIWRPKHIRFQGFDESGNAIKGEARGYLARLLQHEIDHINGKLCKDKYPEGGFYGDFEKMQKIRAEEKRL
jgi:peptide deformylase